MGSRSTARCSSSALQQPILAAVFAVAGLFAGVADADVLSVGGVCQDNRVPRYTGLKWTYKGDRATGPSRWARLNKDFLECSVGLQSPIDLVASESLTVKKPKFLHMWVPANVEARLGNGSQSPYVLHSDSGIEINLRGLGITLVSSAVRSQMTLQKIVLKQPAEHTINGVRHDLEKQYWFVPSDANTSIPLWHHSACRTEMTALSFLYKKTSVQDPYLETLRPYLTAFRDQSLPRIAIPPVIPPEYPEGFAYSYSGSLPYPPCAPTVQWIVSETVLPVTQAQLGLLAHVNISSTTQNTRPPQRRNGRKVERFAVYRPLKKEAFVELAFCDRRDPAAPGAQCAALRCANTTERRYAGGGYRPPSSCGSLMPGSLPHLLTTPSFKHPRNDAPPETSSISGENERLLRAVVVLAAVEIVLMVNCLVFYTLQKVTNT